MRVGVDRVVVGVGVDADDDVDDDGGVVVVVGLAVVAAAGGDCCTAKAKHCLFTVFSQRGALQNGGERVRCCWHVVFLGPSWF